MKTVKMNVTTSVTVTVTVTVKKSVNLNDPDGFSAVPDMQKVHQQSQILHLFALLGKLVLSLTLLVPPSSVARSFAVLLCLHDLVVIFLNAPFLTFLAVLVNALVSDFVVLSFFCA